MSQTQVPAKPKTLLWIIIVVAIIMMLTIPDDEQFATAIVNDFNKQHEDGVVRFFSHLIGKPFLDVNTTCQSYLIVKHCSTNLGEQPITGFGMFGKFFLSY